MATLVEMIGSHANHDEASGFVEIPMRDFTYHRLDSTYPFITSRLPGLSRDLGRPLDVLDVGTHNGIMAKYFIEQPVEVVRSISAVEISEKRVEEVRKQPFLQADILSGRYKVLHMDGTNMESIPDQSVDFINYTEVLVDLEGDPERLIREGNRVAKTGSMSVYTFPNADYYYQDQKGAFKMGHAWKQYEFEAMIRDSYDGDVRIAFFGQMPMTGSEGENALITVNHGSGSFHFKENALDIYSVFEADGKKISNPYFYIACVRKFE